MNIKRTDNGYQLHGIEATGLAPRESQALLLLANGLNFSEIAQHMSTSVGSAKARIQNVSHKLRLPTGRAARVIAAAYKAGNLRLTLALLAALTAGIAMPQATDAPDKAARIVRTLRPGTRNRREFENC